MAWQKVGLKSAGLEFHALNPNAIKVMKEVGIDISNQVSYVINPEILDNTTLVVTLSGYAVEHCSVTPLHVKQVHWSFDDPLKAERTDEEKWAFIIRSFYVKFHRRINDINIFPFRNVKKTTPCFDLFLL